MGYPRMNYNTLIDCQTLRAHEGHPGWVIVDCRFNLSEPDSGRRDYLTAHIPGAVYAHLNEDLSGPPVTDQGRHPLPAPAALAALFGRLGIDASKQVVVYDDASGSICARLWWMLRFMGHERVAVLDGGWVAWVMAGLPVNFGTEYNPGTRFHGSPRGEWLVTLDQVSRLPVLIDSRDPARYRGEVEPLDRVAGHIPGARHRFWKNNLDETGRFLPPLGLRPAFEALLGQMPADQAVFYCGSGVTACHNVLAATHAGLPTPRLYVGSWSEWSADPSRPVAVGGG
jgi:thiosulfate/3-mercaptopyruvate sulfurtransferase